jgi:hypothetical protein
MREAPEAVGRAKPGVPANSSSTLSTAPRAFAHLKNLSRHCEEDETLRLAPKADLAIASAQSKIQFSGVGGLLTYISFTQGADDMSDHDKWISYSHWGMFLTGTKYSK